RAAPEEPPAALPHARQPRAEDRRRAGCRAVCDDRRMEGSAMSGRAGGRETAGTVVVAAPGAAANAPVLPAASPPRARLPLAAAAASSQAVAGQRSALTRAQAAATELAPRLQYQLARLGRSEEHT